MSVKIFISCVTDEFRDYRDQLRTDLTRHNVEVKVQEDFKDYGVPTVVNDDVYISDCDAVIHLVGDMTGAMAQPASTGAILAKYPDLKERFPPLRALLERGEDISYTQWEAWLALYHGKPLLIAQAAHGAPRGPAFASTAASRAVQQAHLDRLRAVERFPGCTFASTDQLAKYVLSSPVLDLLAEERTGAATRGAGLLPYIGLAIGMLVLQATPTVADQWAKTLGVHIAAPLALVLASGCIALPFIYSRYFLMLGASDGLAGSRDRQGYDALRENLATGGAATRLYARWLTTFLDRVDRFFGDAGMVDRTLFPHAFGLRTTAPLWTAPAFDRCMLLAFLYPILAVFIMWAAAGQVGPAEEALGLKQDLPSWMRGAAAAAIGFGAFAYWRSVPVSGWIRTMWVAVAGASAGAGALIGAVADVATDVVAHAFIVAIATAFFVAFEWLNDAAIRNRRQEVFLLSSFVAMISGSLIAAHSLAALSGWNGVFGPLLLFLILLTLLNAPFDWISLGLTRALLRRGIELKGWSPFFLALADALAAAVVIALLAVTMVIGVQTFDALAVHGGGKAVLPLTPLLDGIAAGPEAPKYWWVYALLLSTMIPSLINLAIGGTALIRAIPGLPQVLLRFMPATGGVPTYDRAWIAAVLTLQAALGAILGVAVQAIVAWGLIFHAMPAVGLGLLDLARGLAALDLPARVIVFFAGP